MKYWKLDGRYDVIATGSLLGIKGYKENEYSIPVGYETIIKMYPMDFEEFLWANGITSEMIGVIRNSFENILPVPEAMHIRMKDLILQYTLVGGMPAVVQERAR